MWLAGLSAGCAGNLVGDESAQKETALVLSDDSGRRVLAAVTGDEPRGESGGMSADDLVDRARAQWRLDAWRHMRPNEFLNSIGGVAPRPELPRLASRLVLFVDHHAAHWVGFGDARLYRFHDGVLEDCWHRGGQGIIEWFDEAVSTWPPVQYAEARDGDALLLCTERLGSTLDTGEMAAMVDAMSPDDAADCLTTLAAARTDADADEISAVVLRTESAVIGRRRHRLPVSEQGSPGDNVVALEEQKDRAESGRARTGCATKSPNAAPTGRQECATDRHP